MVVTDVNPEVSKDESEVQSRRSGNPFLAGFPKRESLPLTPKPPGDLDSDLGAHFFDPKVYGHDKSPGV